jgi:hypothetical protein
MIENNFYTEMRNAFYTNYQQNIVPAVRIFEKERKNKLLLAIILPPLLIAIAILLASLCEKFELNEFIEMPVAILCYVLFILSLCISLIIKKNFEIKVKNSIMPIVCSCFEDLKWSVPDSDKCNKIFSESGIIPRFSSSFYDEGFVGSHKGKNMEIVESEFWVGSGKRRSTVFNGVVIMLDMNKEFRSHTVITPASLFKNSPVHNLKRTVLDIAEAEKNFDVFTNNEAETRCLITPIFMQKLMVLKTAFKARGVRCAFYGNTILIALHTSKDLFSLCSLIRPIDDGKQYFKMYEEISSIVEFIDYFTLDQEIDL